jgi:hypothetical protein
MAQLAEQGVLQQYPSTQLLLWHSPEPAQLCPLGFLTAHWLDPSHQ